MAIYKRILLKFSGESLMGEKQHGIDEKRLAKYVAQIKEIHELGVQIGIVIGGGNIFRGPNGTNKGFDRIKGDQMGMLATVINSFALSLALVATDVKACVLTAVRMEPIGEFYNKWKVTECMEAGEMVVMSVGTGNPFFMIDAGSSLRGIEVGTDVMLKGARVNDIHTADPEKDPAAKKFHGTTYDEVLKRGLRVTDLTATCMCKENSLPITVSDMDTVGNLKGVMQGEEIGTLVRNQTSRQKTQSSIGSNYSFNQYNRGTKEKDSVEFCAPCRELVMFAKFKLKATLNNRNMKGVKDILDEVQEKMGMAVMYLEESLTHTRAGKANVRLLDGIRADSCGSMVPINNVVAVTTPDACSIAIKSWDKSMLRVIEKAIIDSNLGIMPENNSEIIRIGIPPLTRERRKQLAKQCKNENETARVSVRSARRDAIDVLKRSIKEGLAEDAQKGGEEELQKIHDKYIKQIDDTLAAKDKETMTV